MSNAQIMDPMGIETKLEFSYDNSGNQIERKFTSFNTSTKQNENEISFSQQFEELIKIYPNPTRGKFYIEWENEISSHISSAEVLSVSAIIQTNRIESKQSMLNIDLTSNQNGIYFVRLIFVDGSILSKKVIKL